MELLQWWNLIFLLPAVAALLYLLLLAFGALPTESDHGDIHLEPGDAHFEPGDVHLEAGDIHLEPGLHVDVHDAHIEIAHHGLPDHVPHDADHDIGLFRGALSLIGVGRIPLSLVLMSFSFLWGFFGWMANQFFSNVLPAPGLFIWPSLAVALVGAGTVTRLLAVQLGRILPRTESYGSSTRELVGRIAEVRYALTETGGTVQLYDSYGTIYEVPARVMPGEPPIPSGERVVLWRYDPGQGTYFAVQDEAIQGIEALGPEPVRSLVR